MSKLAPIRHAQHDFFIADIFDGSPFKDDMASMEHPFFSLSKVKDVRFIRYERNGVLIEISPHGEHGMPTIFDKDILLYCGSLLMLELKKLEASGGGFPPKTLRISTNDLLIATNRVINGNSYDLLENGLKRLLGVSIYTNIKTGGITQKSGFHLIESYEFIESHFVEKRRVALEITVSDWLYNAVIGNDVLTISRDYFRLRKPIERRLYEIARKHCGTRQNEWRISLANLHEKSGSTGRLALFKASVKALIETNHLPDYDISFKKDAEGIDENIIVFTNRNYQLKIITSHIEGLPHIKPETLAKGEKMLEGMGFDFRELHDQFLHSLKTGFDPDSVDGAFINFLKKKTGIKTQRKKKQVFGDN